MKLIKVTFLVLAIYMVACSSKDSINTCKEEVVETSTYLEVKPLTYQGHRYLWFRAQSRKGFGGITHDPDCKCNYRK